MKKAPSIVVAVQQMPVLLVHAFKASFVPSERGGFGFRSVSEGNIPRGWLEADRRKGVKMRAAGWQFLAGSVRRRTRSGQPEKRGLAEKILDLPEVSGAVGFGVTTFDNIFEIKGSPLRADQADAAGGGWRWRAVPDAFMVLDGAMESMAPGHDAPETFCWQILIHRL